MASMEEWDNQEDWGPKYDSWWEVCEVCGGLYNWFDFAVMEGVRMYAWLHKLGYCAEGVPDQPMVWVDLREDNEKWRKAHGGKDPGESEDGGKG